MKRNGRGTSMMMERSLGMMADGDELGTSLDIGISSSMVANMRLGRGEQVNWRKYNRA